jgi:hypothetical protein
MKKAGHKERVLKYMLDFGSITYLDAIADLGVARLADVIFRLRKDGYKIITEDAHGTNRYGEKVTYARYSFAKKEGETNDSTGTESAL